jgi:hypothetical protein
VADTGCAAPAHSSARAEQTGADDGGMFSMTVSRGPEPRYDDYLSSGVLVCVIGGGVAALAFPRTVDDAIGAEPTGSWFLFVVGATGFSVGMMLILLAVIAHGVFLGHGRAVWHEARHTAPPPATGMSEPPATYGSDPAATGVDRPFADAAMALASPLAATELPAETGNGVSPSPSAWNRRTSS